jgi:hypothetical protein
MADVFQLQYERIAFGASTPPPSRTKSPIVNAN